jgi:type II secretion system protein E
MGKKFLSKFLNEAAAKVGKDKQVPAKTKEVIDLESAARFGADFDPLNSITDEELQDELADDAGARYSKPAVELDELAPVDNAAYLRAIAEQHGLSVIDLSKETRPPLAIIRLLTAEQARLLGAIPVKEKQDGTLLIAVSDPANPMITDDLPRIIDREIECVVAADKEIRDRIESYYGMGEESLEDIVSKETTIDDKATSKEEIIEIDTTDPEKLANAPPVIKLVNVLLLKAIKERASDIHIEPFPNLIRIRYRVDGVLREIPSPPRQFLAGLISRIKVMSKLDIAETRMPQDGRIKIGVENREIDLRISTVPTVHGEAVVMRVLDKSMMMIGISQIGMKEEILAKFNKHIAKPNGIVLVTGPTGSGKTTTLYAALNEIKDPGEKLITVEDPVEFELPGIVQVNINEAVGLTFSKCLRAILRQDPDTVLVGEIRDVETAQIAVQASLTGHLVFSTLHTNSASATVTRLIDMGVKPFLITSSVQAVIGQRLVRTICPACRIPYTPDHEEISEFNIDADELKEYTFFHGEGCSECGHTGYRGRMGLFELLEVSEPMRELILDQASTDEIQELAVREGMLSMRQDGWEKICLGLSTFEEVARETPRDVAVEPYQGGDQETGEGEQAPDAVGEGSPKIEEVRPETKPEISAPPRALPNLNQQTMGVEGEAGARVYEIGDAERGA